MMTDVPRFAASTFAPRTLVELFRWRACLQPDQRTYTFVKDGEDEESHLTYGELDRKARAIGVLLQSLEATGERALLLYPPGLEYIAAFFGCLYAGVVAVPAYPPRPNRSLARLEAIVADAQATVALATAQILSNVERQFAHTPKMAALRWYATDELTDSLEDGRQEPAVDCDTLACLQYTSGSTGAPKGVLLSHGNLLSNLTLIAHRLERSPRSVGVTWLPPYHDMGLIDGLLQPLYSGYPTIVMSPVSFLQRPFRWLQAISRYKATTSGGPNFAYELCVRKIPPEQRATLDLSNWSTAYNGAEPIRPEALDRFAAAFEPCGFRREAFYPCYGLAEATLFVSGGLKAALPVVRTFHGTALEQNRVVEASAGDESARALVGCGQTLPGQQIVIVHPESLTRCLPGQVGEVWVSGPSVAQGYWNRPEETECTFQAHLAETGEGPFLRTGDLGFLHDGELFVAGRLKDLIIIRGRNHYPQDIELTVERSHPVLRPGCGAAFSIDVAGEERLVMVQEVENRQPFNVSALIDGIRQAVAEEHEVQVYAVVLIKPGSIPKTSSGKIQRHACRAGFLAGSLDAIGSSILDDFPSVWSDDSFTRDALLAMASEQRQPLLEASLQGQVARVLRVVPSRLDLQQPLNTLGLDSLMAVELQHGLEASLGVVVPMVSFLQGSSIAQLATQVLAQVTAPVSVARITPAPAQEAIAEHPLSPGQQGLWFLSQLQPDISAYNIPVALRIRGRLHGLALAQSLNEIVRRHEALRTTMATVEGQPVQVIAPTLTVPLPVVDLRALLAPEREPQVQRLALEEVQRPFDLAQGPLLRATLLRVGEEDHVMFLTMHHIVSDGWSMGVLIRELARLYEAFSAGQPSPLPKLPIQYADFAIWQRQWLQGAVLEVQLAYWTQRLAGMPPMLELPTDRPRPPVQTFRGGRRSLVLSKPLTEALTALSRRAGVTLFMTLLAAFKVLLHRYTGEEDIVVGSPIAGRNRPETEDLIGFFVNTLPLRTDFSGNPSFRELLGRVREVALGAYAHQDLPFGTLVEVLQPARDPSRTPLFQVMFNLLPFAEGRIELPGLTVEILSPPDPESKFDVTLYAREQSEGIQLELVYNADLFERARMVEMLEQLQYLLWQIGAKPEERIGRFSLVTPRAEALLPNPAQALRSDGEGAVHTQFSQQARRVPERLAVVDKEGAWSYRDLDVRSNQLAHYLRASGIRPQDIVAIYAHRSASLLWALLGVLKAGAAFVILDPIYPAARLIDYLRVAKPRGWLQIEAAGVLPNALEEFVAALPWRCRFALPHRTTAAAHPLLMAYSIDGPGAAVGPDDLAYVAFTSGTTGMPKGILGTHRPLSHFLEWHSRTFGLNESDRFSMLSGLSHDPLLRDIFTPLWLGATLCIPDPEDIGSPGRLAHWMKQEAISVAHLTPAMGQLLTEATRGAGATTADREDAAPTSLRYVFFGGDVLTTRDVSRLRKLAPSATGVNFYGATETPQAMGYFIVPNQPDLAHDDGLAQGQSKASIPLGRGIEDVQLLVLNASSQLAGVGEAGEIHVRTPYLAKGYLGDDALTQERFIVNPLAKMPGAHLYKTGDGGRYRADGTVEFVGRLDEQVKLRGFRVEPGEIEAVLGQHPAVRESVVVAREDGSGEKRLVAYVVPDQEPAPTSSDLRRFLKERLPEYLVPAALVLLEALPLTPNGKVDRQALPVPDQARPDLAGAFVAPRTPVEEVLAAIWGQILGVEQVGLDDHFFELGGHSLLATQVISRLRDAFRVELPLRHLFETPTVAGLAERIETARWAGQGRQAPPLRPISRDGALPLSFAQQRLWFLEQLAPGSPAYNIPAAVRLGGPLPVAALAHSLTEVGRRHEAVRTSVATVAGRPVQVIAPGGRGRLPVVDLCGLPAGEREAQVQQLARAEAQRPFELAQGPLVRATLLRLGAAEHVLLLTLHHIVADAWSLGVLLREVAALYEAYTTGQPSPLPELRLQYADFAHWQRQWLQGAELEEQLAYWTRQLGGDLPGLDVPTDRPRPVVQSWRGARQALELSQPLTEALKALSRRAGVTLFMTLLAAFQVLLARYTGQEDIVVGTPIANRTRGELEGLIGFFVNTLVLRTDLSGNPTFRELLARVREGCLEAYAHQDVPFEQLVEALQPARDLSRTPLVQVMVDLQNAPMPALALAGLTLRPVEVHSGTAKFELSLSLVDTAQGLVGALEYNTDLFEAATMARLLGHFRTLLEGIVAAPEQRLAELPLLTAGERRQLLGDWNATQAAYPQGRCIQALFEAQAARTPDAIAVGGGEGQLTYRELNRRANQLAQHLRRLGVEPEGRVGLYLERGLELVVGLLGVLKAGGAYVPLDPTYPQQRLAFMLEDANVPVLLTQRRLVEGLPAPGARVICLDTDWEAIAREHEGNPDSRVRADNLAYVIYTSGSTGQPKGTEIQHAGLVNLVTWHQHVYNVTPADRATQLAGLAFDASVWDLWPYLAAGASIHIPDEETRAAPSKLLEWLAAEAITICFLPTPLAEPILEERFPTGLALRALLTGGDKLHRGPREALPFGLVNHYGPTENTVVTTWIPVAAATETDAPPPIGRPIANTQVYLLDRHLQPAPIGVPGELYIGGTGLARGYLHHPELTAERFMPNPFSDESGARLYRTGDLARYLPDGNIEFLRRLDHQVKLRGFRVELAEIEAVLHQHPAVRESVVLAREEAPGDKRLVAYVVSTPEQPPTTHELRHFLQQQLPDYMVPSAFVWLEALPLTPNGKVDRGALPAPELGGLEQEGTFVVPRTPREEVLARIWAEVLGLARVGVHDNFFALGGDSILSIQIIARANQAGLWFTPKQLFQHQTIAELAAVAARTQAIPAEQGLVTGPVPLTPIQRWFFEQQLPDPYHWNQAILLETRQALVSSLLERAVRHLLVHHDALRLRFRREASGWQQVIAEPDEAVPFTRLDVSGLPEVEQRSAIEAVAAELQASLSLAEGPLVRVAYFDLGSGKPGRLLLVIHHLAVDGVSWRILLEDLQTAYQQLSRGAAIELPPKTTSFMHWALRLTEYARSAELQQELHYWLAESRRGVSRLPMDYPGGANTVASAHTVSVTLSVEETRALLQEVPAAYHTQINEVLLTALVQAFARWTGGRSLLVDLEGHGRGELFEGVDLSRTVGWFTAIVPVWLELPEANDPEEALKWVKEQLRRLPNQGIGYGVLRYLSKAAAIGEQLRPLPQPEVRFNYLGQFDQVLLEDSLFGLAQESSGPTYSPWSSRHHRLEVNGIITGGQLQLAWTYSENLHRRSTIEGFAQGFVEALRSLIAHCLSPEAGGYTPSDFPEAGLSRKDLDRFIARISQVGRGSE